MSDYVEQQPVRATANTGREERKIIFASSLGTVFEWYDFFLYGALAAVISKQFFAGVNDTTAFIFALMAFAAGFLVRPFGALVFGRLGDMIGRKYTFLMTIILMGLSTFAVGLLPTYTSIGIAAPIILVLLRMLQGLALGGEYGGAATYVAEHAPISKRGSYTGWIQSTATLGLLLSLLVVLASRYISGDQFEVWGWRLPFLLSIFLLAISTWIRLSMHESPAFVKMKSEGKVSRSPIRESFGSWQNLKIVLIALFSINAGQAVTFYTAQFYVLFFMTQMLKMDPTQANTLLIISVVIGAPFFVLFGWLSDKIGRKPMLIAFGVAGTLGTYPLLTTLQTTKSPLFAFLLICIAWMIVSGYTALTATVKAEMFPTAVRAMGVGIPYALTAAIFGGSVDAVALQFKNSGYEAGFYWYATGCIFISLLFYIFIPDTKTHSKMEQAV